MADTYTSHSFRLVLINDGIDDKKFWELAFAKMETKSVSEEGADGTQRQYFVERELYRDCYYIPVLNKTKGCILDDNFPVSRKLSEKLNTNVRVVKTVQPNPAKVFYNMMAIPGELFNRFAYNFPSLVWPYEMSEEGKVDCRR